MNGKAHWAAILAAVVAVCALGILPARAGLVNHWSMEEGTGSPTADLVGGADAALMNGASWSADAAPGSTASIQFGGNPDHLRANGYKGVTGKDPRSVSAWVKTTDQTATIASWGQNSGGQKWTFRVQNSNGPVNGNIRVEVNGGYQVGNTVVTDNQWHHTAVTWADDGINSNVNDARLWVDGELQGITASQGRSINTASSNDVRIGTSVSGDGKWYNGNIDDVRIYSHAIDRSEVRALAGLAPDGYFETVKALAPIGYWRLGEARGNKAFNEGTRGAAIDGEYRNGVVLDQPGTPASPGNASAEFDGNNDLVNIVGYKGITGTDPRSVSAWIKTTAVDNEPIISWGSNNDGRKWVFRVQDDNGQNGAIRIENNNGYQVGTTNVADGQWHHVALTWEADGASNNINDARLWVDGVLQGVSASKGNGVNTASGANVRIGRAVIDGRFFDGGIDEVQLYDRALSRGEIRSLANAAPDPYYTAVQADAPIAYWRLGEESGGKAFNEGTLGSLVDGSYNGVANNRKGVPGLVPTSPNAAVRLDNSGGDHVNIPDNAAINTSGDYFNRSFEAWINSEDTGGRRVIYEQGGASNGFNMYTQKADGDLYLRYGAWEGNGATNHFPSRVEIEPGQTYHAAFTFDAPDDTMVLYVNGAPMSGKVNNNVTSIPSHSGDVAIGAKRDATRFDNGGQGGGGNRFEGVIDEVALYDTTLNLRSVQTHYVVGSGDRLGITPGATLGVLLNYDAGVDTNGADGWQDTIGSRPNGAGVNQFDWSGSLNHTPADSPLFESVGSAYQFTAGQAASMRTPEDIAGNPTNNSASIEALFKPTDFSGNEVILEFGGGTDGTTLWLSGSTLHFRAKDNANNAHAQWDLTNLRDDWESDFIHAIGVIDLDSNLVQLYVDGMLVDSGSAAGDMGDWTGGNNAGLGGIADGSAYGSGGFAGDIAVVRLYEGVLSADEVRANFDSLVVPEPATVTLTLLGLGGLGLRLRKRRRRA